MSPLIEIMYSLKLQVHVASYNEGHKSDTVAIYLLQMGINNGLVGSGSMCSCNMATLHYTL